MKRLILLGLFVLLAFRSFSDSIIVSGEVSGVWNTDTVLVQDDIFLAENNSLEIGGGCTVIFNHHSSFDVYGSLKAAGNMQEQISFLVDDTTGFSDRGITQGGWKGVRIYDRSSESDSVIFEHCRFTYSKAVDTTESLLNGGAIHVENFGRVKISHCSFENNFAALNGGAISLFNSGILIEACEFVNNHCGPVDDPWGYGGAICSDSSDVKIIFNRFTDNTSTGVGGGLAIRFLDARVCNNVFDSNYSALGGAMAFLHYHENSHTQCNNLVFNNASEFFGGGIANIDAGPVFVNNTIVYNLSVYGGGFYVKDSLTPKVYNNIIWGNEALSGFGNQVYLWDYNACADFYYCLVEEGKEGFAGSGGGTGYQGTYENNIEISPLFADSLGHDYHLTAESPCINSGRPDTSGLQLPETGADSLPRILNGRIDMGCYESLFTGFLPAPEQNAFRIYPNPAGEWVHVEPESTFAGNSEFSILNLKGVSMKRIKSNEKNIQSIHIGELPAGVYIIRMRHEKDYYSNVLIKNIK